MHLMEAPPMVELTDSAFRAWLALLAYVARWRGECDHVNGEFPFEWHRFAQYAKPRARGRVTKRQVEKFIALGLLVPRVDEAGKAWLRVKDWRDLKPTAGDWTLADRQTRWRLRNGYHGRRQILTPLEEVRADGAEDAS